MFLGIIFCAVFALSSPKEVRPAYDPVLVARGQQYLADLHTRACLELDRENVMSRAAQDKLVCELADPRLTQIIPLLEQGDPSAILGDKITRERARIYTLIATQGADAYKLKKQPTNSHKKHKLKKPRGNSHGMYQMTVKTYHAMRKGYPAANLPKTFMGCSQDHVCSAKFAILYNDANTSFLARRIPARWHEKMPIKTFAHARYLAGAYTSGMPAYYMVRQSRADPSWVKKMPKAQWRNYLQMLENLWYAPQFNEVNT